MVAQQPITCHFAPQADAAHARLEVGGAALAVWAAACREEGERKAHNQKPQQQLDTSHAGGLGRGQTQDVQTKTWSAEPLGAAQPSAQRLGTPGRFETCTPPAVHVPPVTLGKGGQWQ